MIRRRAALRRDETAGQVRLRQAYGGTSRPDKCLVVKSLDSSLRPVSHSQHGIHRHHHQGVEDREGRRLLGCPSYCPLSQGGGNQTVLLLALSRREGRHTGATRKRNLPQLDFKVSVPNIILDSNSHICFRKFMLTKTTAKTTMHAVVDATRPNTRLYDRSTT